MKKVMTLMVMLMCVMSYAGITIECEYKEGVGKDQTDWKPGIMWGDDENHLLCWGPKKVVEFISTQTVPATDGRKDMPYTVLALTPESGIKGYMMIGPGWGRAPVYSSSEPTNAPALFHKLKSVEYNVYAMRTVKKDYVMSGMSLITPKGGQVYGEKYQGVHLWYRYEDKMVEITTMAQPGKLEYRMRFSSKQYRLFRMLIDGIPEKQPLK